MIKVVIVEHNDTIRDGLNLIINSTEGISSIGAYSNCEKMLKNIKKLNPDVLLIDLILPWIRGSDSIRLVKALLPDIRIIVLTVYDEDDLLFDALCAGAIGYITKYAPPSKLLYIIKESYNGHAQMNSKVASKIISLLGPKTSSINRRGGKILHLTINEKEILCKLVEGNNLRAISNSLSTNVDNIRADFRNIYDKLHIFHGVENSSETN